MSKSVQISTEWKTSFIPMTFQKGKVFRHLLFDLGYTGEHLITCSKLWFTGVRLNYREKQERERDSNSWNAENNGTSATAGNSFSTSVSYITLCLQKQSDIEISPWSKSSFLPHLIQKDFISSPLKSLITIFAHKNKPRKKPNYWT